MSVTLLSANELRVLGTLCEKQRTVPDTYPLSLNALLAGCNQKTSRHPVMELTESDVSLAIDGLRDQGYVVEVTGSRVLRYEHRLEKNLHVPSQSGALLTVLMLRGPQTAGELRLNGDRLHAFADISSVEAFLHELAERRDGALVRELPRAPGARENRWAHCLGNESQTDAGMAVTTLAAGPDLTGLAPLLARIEALEADVAALKAQVAAGRV
jgi:uncharacterized protein YceH (UPF0502 family)